MRYTAVRNKYLQFGIRHCKNAIERFTDYQELKKKQFLIFRYTEILSLWKKNSWRFIGLLNPPIIKFEACSFSVQKYETFMVVVIPYSFVFIISMYCKNILKSLVLLSNKQYVVWLKLTHITYKSKKYVTSLDITSITFFKVESNRWPCFQTTNFIFKNKKQYVTCLELTILRQLYTNIIFSNTTCKVFRL